MVSMVMESQDMCTFCRHGLSCCSASILICDHQPTELCCWWDSPLQRHCFLQDVPPKMPLVKGGGERDEAGPSVQKQYER
ncbi:hypothetical protein AOLI_G00295880 [Acnodon oligacanthus]